MLFRAVFSLPGHSMFSHLVIKGVFLCLAIGVPYLLLPLSSIVSASYLPAIIQIQLDVCSTKPASLSTQYKEDYVLHHMVDIDFVVKTQAQFVRLSLCCLALFNALTEY